MALVGVLAVFLFVPNSAIGATIIIDDMSVVQGGSGTPAVADSSGGPFPATDTDGVTGAPANLIGGARLLEITHTAGAGATTSGWVNTTTPHAWHVQNSDQATGWGRAVWCGSSNVADIDGVYTLALDLTNLDYFNFIEVFADQITTFTFEVFTDATNGARATIDLTANETKNNVHLAKTTDFTNIGAGVDWSNVQRIELRIDPVLAVDTRCLEIQAITEEPGLACTKTFDKSIVKPLDEITATVVITNTGTGDVATSVKVVDILDAGLTYKETVATYPAPDTVVGQTLTWDSLGPLNPGDSVTLKYVITVVTIAEGDPPLCNDVTATAIAFPGTVTNCYGCVSMIDIPTAPIFTQWGMIGFLLVIGAIAVRFMRRRSSVS